MSHARMATLPSFLFELSYLNELKKRKLCKLHNFRILKIFDSIYKTLSSARMATLPYFILELPALKKFNGTLY